MQALIALVFESLRVLANETEDDEVSVRCADLRIALQLDGSTVEDLAAIIAEAWELCSAY